MKPQLPTEILAQVVRDAVHLASPSDLLHLRLANQKLRDISSPYAFRTLHVVYTPTSAQGLARLLENPDIAGYVQEISFVENAEKRGLIGT